jgi:uncharacterized protein
MAQPSVQGRLIWKELITEDPAALVGFYGKVLGWRAQPSPLDPTYTTFATRSGPVAGAPAPKSGASEPGAHPHWLLYIGVDDVDATVAKAVPLGAKVLLAATDMDKVGRFAVLTDPLGASFAIIKPAEAMPEGKMKPGDHVWLELATTDFEAAFKFYEEIFGWEVVQRLDMGPAGVYLLFGKAGIQRGGIYKTSQAPSPYWVSYTEVGEVEKTIAAATKAGGRLLSGPHTVPGGGRIAQLIDPSGAVFAVHTMAKVETPAAPPAASAPPAPAKPAAPKKSVVKAAPAAPATAAPPSVVAKPAAKKAVAKTVVPPPATPPAAVKKKAAAKKKVAPKPAAPAKKAAKKSVKKAAKKVVKKAPKKKKAAAKKKKVVSRASARPPLKNSKPAKKKKGLGKKQQKKDKKRRKKEKARRKK